MTKIKISKKGFICAYCGKKRIGAYRIVDYEKSCEKCNRAYDYQPKMYYCPCPLCKGEGQLKIGEER